MEKRITEVLETLEQTNPEVFNAITAIILSYDDTPVIKPSSSDTTGGGEHPPKPPNVP